MATPHAWNDKKKYACTCVIYNSTFLVQTLKTNFYFWVIFTVTCTIHYTYYFAWCRNDRFSNIDKLYFNFSLDFKMDRNQKQAIRKASSPFLTETENDEEKCTECLKQRDIISSCHKHACSHQRVSNRTSNDLNRKSSHDKAATNITSASLSKRQTTHQIPSIPRRKAPSDTQNIELRFPIYKDLDQRLESFMKWKIPVDKMKMAEAGFIYIGRKL